MPSDLSESSIGMHRDSAASGDMAGFSERGENDLGASAAQQIDGSNGLDLFEAVSQQHKDGGHEY
jgi:hypothetical protein